MFRSLYHILLSSYKMKNDGCLVKAHNIKKKKLIFLLTDDRAVLDYYYIIESRN